VEFKNIRLEIKNRIAVVTVSRPDKLNALNESTLSELSECFGFMRTDVGTGIVILTGAGEKAFVAGADIYELSRLNEESAKLFSERGQEVFNAIENFEKPVIAAVNGFALGGGCELALACHIRLASENAKFGQPEVNLGVIPGYGGTQRLTRLINAGRSAEMILTGELIDANEAYRIGLVNKVYPQAELMTRACELAGKILSKSAFALKNAISSIAGSAGLSRSEGEKVESALFALCCSTDDFKEGISAFFEKRKPDFKNR